MENGKVKVHVVRPNLEKTPLESGKDLGNWLHFIEVSPPSVGLGCIVSHDPVILLIIYQFITSVLILTIYNIVKQNPSHFLCQKLFILLP